METYPSILQEQGWKLSLGPVYFLGFDISWLVMNEAFISPFNHKKHLFPEALRLAFCHCSPTAGN
jgi:hypothetical protein